MADLSSSCNAPAKDPTASRPAPTRAARSSSARAVAGQRTGASTSGAGNARIGCAPIRESVNVSDSGADRPGGRETGPCNR